jgi:hypothetical protein
MARHPRTRGGLDGDQAAALGRLRAAFGTTQVTVTSIQPTSQPTPDPAPTATAAAPPTLLEEASCTSTCT